VDSSKKRKEKGGAKKARIKKNKILEEEMFQSKEYFQSIQERPSR